MSRATKSLWVMLQGQREIPLVYLLPSQGPSISTSSGFQAFDEPTFDASGAILTEILFTRWALCTVDAPGAGDSPNLGAWVAFYSSYHRKQ
jgi:hypothetical protein